MTGRYAAIVLAAGHARRFGSDKLMAGFRSKPLLHHALTAARAAPVEAVALVCRERLDLGPFDEPPPVDQVVVASEALADSLRAGLQAVGDVDGAFVFLGDMPLVPHAMAEALARALQDSFAALPRCNGAPGHPVLLSRRAFGAVTALTGDAGAGRLLKSRADVVHLDTDDDGVLLDIDCAEDLARLSDRPRRPDISR